MSKSTSDPPARPAGRAPALRWLGHRHYWVLILVVVLLLALTTFPALDVLQPVRAVRVMAVIPVAVSADPTPMREAGLETEPRPTRLVQAPGWLEPDPYYTAVSALADGVVASIHVLEGERVEAGQLVAELVKDDAELALRSAEADLASAEANLRLAEAELKAAQVDWDEPVERDRAVAATAAGLQEARAELAQLPAMIEEAEATLKRWREELARIEHISEAGAATDRELIVARQQVAARRAALKSMEAREPILNARIERLDAERVAAQRAADLRVDERRRLDRAKAQVMAARAETDHARTTLAEAELRLDRMTIHAPMDGYVMRRLKTPGDKVMLAMDDRHSAHFIHMYDPDHIQVRVDVPLADASQVFVGQSCEVIVDVLPDMTFKGQVTRITHEADLQKNTLQVKVRVIDPSPLLRPEMLTRVKFLPRGGGEVKRGDGADTRSRVKAPTACLDGDRVWVVRDRRGLRGRVEPEPVTVLGQENGYATVISNLRPGDLLVSRPEALTPGETVRFDGQEGGGA